VIVFDQRGIGNTTLGTNPYTPQQLGNDTAGLLDALKIPKADVMGYSLGSYLAEQLTMMYPDKVNRLILVAASCGGKDHTPKPPEFLELQSTVVNNSLNNIPITQEQIKSFVTASLGSGWIKLHPESLEGFENITTFQQMKPAVNPEMVNNQNNIGKHWEDNPTWSGACDELAKLAKPTLVITGTDDNFYQPHVNSLKIVEKIPGAWLVQIKDASHGVVNQYPAEIGKILNTFLSTTSPNN
jgi:pimeloyl-ACP methyl ester carboxylesterase